MQAFNMVWLLLQWTCLQRLCYTVGRLHLGVLYFLNKVSRYTLNYVNYARKKSLAFTENLFTKITNAHIHSSMPVGIIWSSLRRFSWKWKGEYLTELSSCLLCRISPEWDTKMWKQSIQIHLRRPQINYSFRCADFCKNQWILVKIFCAEFELSLTKKKM